jgi:hypothetical protein
VSAVAVAALLLFPQPFTVLILAALLRLALFGLPTLLLLPALFGLAALLLLSLQAALFLLAAVVLQAAALVGLAPLLLLAQLAKPGVGLSRGVRLVVGSKPLLVRPLPTVALQLLLATLLVLATLLLQAALLGLAPLLLLADILLRAAQEVVCTALLVPGVPLVGLLPGLVLLELLALLVLLLPAPRLVLGPAAGLVLEIALPLLGLQGAALLLFALVLCLPAGFVLRAASGGIAIIRASQPGPEPQQNQAAQQTTSHLRHWFSLGCRLAPQCIVGRVDFRRVCR